MSVAAIRSAIRDVMLTVPDIGVVHAYERYARDLAALRPLYVHDGQLRGWFIRRLRTTEERNLPPRSIEIVRWRIQGFMALDDDAASELAMDTLIEGLRGAFRVNPTVNGTCHSTSVPLPPNSSGDFALQLEDFGPVSFAGVLCHGARCALTTTRYL